MTSPHGSVLRCLRLGGAAAFLLAWVRLAAASPDWTSWAWSSELEVRNNATVQLPAGYSVHVSLDTAALIASGRLRSDCADLRVSHGEGSEGIELDRLVEQCGTPATSIWFRTVETVDVAEFDDEYELHYGNPSADQPPQDPKAVWSFYDDFSDGDAQGWHHDEGVWSVVPGGTDYVYRYSGGGLNWVVSWVDRPDLSDVELTAKVRASDAPQTNWIGLAFRIQDSSNFQVVYESRDISQFKAARIESDAHTLLQFPSSAMPADTWYQIRVQALDNHIRARIWPADSPEPSTWPSDVFEYVYHDNGGIGVALYNAPAAADWDDVRARKLVDIEPSVTQRWETRPWWDAAWGFRTRLTIQNASPLDSLPPGYSMAATIDTASLIAAGKLAAGCGDLRVVSFDGSPTEVDRVIEDCGTDHTKVWFSSRRSLGGGARDDGYDLYYGNSAEQSPLSDGANVFLYYEDWERGAAHWTGGAGRDPSNTGTFGSAVISTEESSSPSSSLKFTTPSSNGDVASGFLPVAPGTGYAVQVEGMSITGESVSVGVDQFDPSTATLDGTWLWSSGYVLGPQWTRQSARFTTLGAAAFLRVKSEWSVQGPGVGPVYVDNFVLRYSAATEPTVGSGDEATRLPAPEISGIADNGPVAVGTPVVVSATITATEGAIAAAHLRVIAPDGSETPLTEGNGDALGGLWQGSFTPVRAGLYSYEVLAQSTIGRSTVSEVHTVSSVDSTPPQITLVSIMDPIVVRSTQTVSARVLDDGLIGQVNVQTPAGMVPMVRSGDLFTASFAANSVGTVAFTLLASDSAGNVASLPGSFQVQPRDVDVCIWKGCRKAAASFAIDDGWTICSTDFAAAGFTGTYYYNGTTTKSWFAAYSAQGHEIASHTATHPCNPPTCYPTCTQAAVDAIPYTSADVNAYRQNQIEPNIAAIEAGTGVPVVSLAWPCGCTDPGRMAAASPYVLGARGYFDSVASLYWVADNEISTPAQLMNLRTHSAWDQGYVESAISQGRWAIITSHGSCAGISYMGSRSDVLWSAPVGSVLKYILVRNAATFAGYVRTAATIDFDAAHSLAPMQRQQLDGTPMSTITFDDPVTLRARLLAGDVVLGVTVDGAPAAWSLQTESGVSYVFFDAPLQISRHVTVTLETPPLGASAISGDGGSFSWSALPGAASYDVVYGDLDTLRQTGGDFSVATQPCLFSHTTATSVPFAPVPPDGAGYWLLIRGVNAKGPGTYDSGAPSQTASRDPGIAASPQTCP